MIQSHLWPNWFSFGRFKQSKPTPRMRTSNSCFFSSDDRNWTWFCWLCLHRQVNYFGLIISFYYYMYLFFIYIPQFSLILFRSCFSFLYILDYYLFYNTLFNFLNIPPLTRDPSNTFHGVISSNRLHCLNLL